MQNRERTKVLNVRMSADEVAMLATLAQEDGIAVSAFVRQIIRRAFAERHPAKAKKMLAR